MDDVIAETDGKDMSVSSGLFGTTEDITEILVSPDWDEASGKDPVNAFLYSMEEGTDKVLLKLDFLTSSEDDPELVSAMLQIETDDGTATCYYYADEGYASYGYGVGYTAILQKAKNPFKHTYYPDSAQEAIDIMYPVVYPDGLE